MFQSARLFQACYQRIQVKLIIGHDGLLWIEHLEEKLFMLLSYLAKSFFF